MCCTIIGAVLHGQISVSLSFFYSTSIHTTYGDIGHNYLTILSMVDNDRIINIPTAITTYTLERICTSMHNIDIHSYTIQRRCPIAVLGNKTSVCQDMPVLF